MVQEVLGEAGIAFEEVDIIASTNGPGSFTGLRLGLATARALGLALNKPVVGVNTFDFMVAHYRSIGVTGELLIVIETKRKDFYAQSFDEQDVALSDMMATSPEDILNSIDRGVVKIGGDCLERFVSAAEKDDLTLLDNVTQPDPILLCDIVSKRPYPTVSLLDNCRVEPIYLRGADISMPKNKPRVLES
jgi:tRNA threonylcarbamoyladenosine biosynthesis protein TsaB